jgi:imidazolonepropionase-like amidohydrolase
VRARWQELKRAKDRGVLVTVGTDNIQGILPLEIVNLVDAGFTPLEAITAATGIAAEVVGIDEEVGTIERGKFADLIAVRGRPDEDIDDLFGPIFIMVGGRDFSGLSFR